MARSQNGSNGRDRLGRFQPGCPPGPGNPWLMRLNAYRNAWHAAVSDADLQAVARTLVGQAIEGDVAAARLVLQYSLGSADELPLGRGMIDLAQAFAAIREARYEEP
jgi:hypothetical protein